MLCLSVWVFCPINVKTAKSIGPKFCVGLHIRKVIDDQMFKNLPPSKFDFH